MKELLEKLNKTIEERKVALKQQEEQLYMDYGCKVVKLVESFKEKYSELCEINNIRLRASLEKGKRESMHIDIYSNGVSIFLTNDYSFFKIFGNDYKKSFYFEYYAKFLYSIKNWEQELENSLLNDLSKQYIQKVEKLERKESFLEKLRKGLE